MFDLLCEGLAETPVLGFRWGDGMGWSKQATHFERESEGNAGDGAMTVIWDKHIFTGSVPMRQASINISFQSQYIKFIDDCLQTFRWKRWYKFDLWES